MYPVYDSIIVTLILLVEVYDVLLEHKKQERNKIRRKVNQILKNVLNRTK